MGEIARVQKSTPARKAAKKTPAKKAAAKKAVAKKAAPRKAPAKKAAAKKAPAKKAAAKKVAPKKAPAKKAPAKKVAPKKAPAKKAAAKKVAPEKASRTSSRADQSATTGTKDSARSMRALPAPPEDPRVILGVTESFTKTDLRRRWRAYAAIHHPDGGGDAVTFARGQQAYAALLRQL